LRADLLGQARAAEAQGEALQPDAVERAVAAAREVFASNDPDKAAAQDALRDGDVAKAEAALAAAFEREKRAAVSLSDEADQLRQKTARTATEKAALAATRSTAEAIEWYEQAAALVPDDCWTHIELRRLYATAGNLGTALEAAQRARQTAATDRDASVAGNEIGDVLRAQGDLGKALDSYRASLDIRERLAAADASNAALQRDLSVSYEKVGDVLERMDDVGGAVEAYERSLPIAEALAARWPDHPQFRSDVEIIWRRLAALMARPG
jgi:tetratricopeptide (TPR) repeat protein